MAKFNHRRLNISKFFLYSRTSPLHTAGWHPQRKKKERRRKKEEGTVVDDDVVMTLSWMQMLVRSLARSFVVRSLSYKVMGALDWGGEGGPCSQNNGTAFEAI